MLLFEAMTKFDNRMIVMAMLKKCLLGLIFVLLHMETTSHLFYLHVCYRLFTESHFGHDL